VSTKHQVISRAERTIGEEPEGSSRAELLAPIFIGRWAPKTLFSLKEQPHRHGELRLHVGHVSQGMLTRTLRDLESTGLIARYVTRSKPIAVECSLSRLGKTLIGPLRGMRCWAKRHGKDVSAVVHLLVADSPAGSGLTGQQAGLGTHMFLIAQTFKGWQTGGAAKWLGQAKSLESGDSPRPQSKKDGKTRGQRTLLQCKVNTTTRNYGIQHVGDSNRSLEEGDMCPACIASTAVMVAGGSAAGGILAMYIGKFTKVFRANCLGLFQKMKEK